MFYKLRALFLTVSLALFFVIFFGSKSGELFFYDKLLFLRARLNPIDTHNLPIMFVCIDDSTLKDITEWPIPRKYYAVILSALKEFQADRVIFDILFLAPSQYDEEFAVAMNDFGKVYLPTAASFKDESTLSQGSIQGVLSASAYKKGVIFIKPDIDGKRRRIPIVKVLGNKKRIYNIAFLASMDMLNIKLSQLRLKDGEELSYFVDRGMGDIDEVHIPLDKENQLLLDYPGKWEESFNKIPFSALIKLYLRKKNNKPLTKEEQKMINKIKGSCCIIGVTALGTPDLAATPLESRCPMVMTHGVLISSILKGRFLNTMPLYISLIFFFIMSLPALLIRSSMKKMWLSWGATALFSAFIIVFLFALNGVYVKAFSSLTASIVFTMLSSAHIYIVSLREKQKIEYEMNLAAEIQKKMLPELLPSTHSIESYVFFRPAIFVAGDFYNAWQSNDSLVVFLGDVSGKGASAALYVSSIITAERVLRPHYESEHPEKLITELNRFLSKNKISGLYATACLVEIKEDGPCRIVDCGHTGIWIYRRQQDLIEEVKGNTHKPLGIDKWEKYSAYEFVLNKGDVALLFTDGFLEARAGEDFVSEEELKEWIISNIDISDCAIGDFMDSFYEYASQSDDITLFIIRKK